MTTHEHAFVLAARNRVTPHAAPALARPRERPRRTHGKTAQREGNGAGNSPARHDPVNAGRAPDAPNDAPTGESRHDHPDAPARRRGRPWPLEHASPVLTDRRPPGLGRGPQPAAETHTTSTRRADGQKPCSGQNTGRESPTITPGAPFFSVFALLLVFASILGFVFQSDPGFQRQLIDSTLERMPVIGPQVSGDIGSLTGSGVALALGLAGALWTGLGVTLAIGNALDRIWAVPYVQRPGFLRSRSRGLLVLATVGAINVLATSAVGVVTAGGVGSAVTEALSLVASAVIDLVLFAASFRLLTAAQVTIRQVLPGALLAAACWLGLQALGGIYVTQVLAGSTQTYGGFAAVVGLLSWLLIASELILIAAELNVVLARRLWPRSLTGELVEADRQVLRDSAHSIPGSTSPSDSDSAAARRPGERPARSDQTTKPDDSSRPSLASLGMRSPTRKTGRDRRSCAETPGPNDAGRPMPGWIESC